MIDQDRALSVVLRQSMWFLDDLARDWQRAKPQELAEAAQLLRQLAHLMETHLAHSGEQAHAHAEIEAPRKAIATADNTNGDEQSF